MKKSNKLTTILTLSVIATFAFFAYMNKDKKRPKYSAKHKFEKSVTKTESNKPMIIPEVTKKREIASVRKKFNRPESNTSTQDIENRMLHFLPKGTKVEFFPGDSFVETKNDIDTFKEVYTIETTLPSGKKGAFNAIYNPQTKKIEYTWGMKKSVGDFFKRRLKFYQGKRASNN